VTDRDLPTLLRELHDALERNEPLDDETRALVADVRVDLSRALDAPDAEANTTLGARLRGVLKHFEERHPDLVAVTQRVLNQLADLGV
jgi:hypothetical protein